MRYLFALLVIMAAAGSLYMVPVNAETEATTIVPPTTAPSEGATPAESDAHAIAIDHPWARATLPKATSGVVYLRLTNHGIADDALIGAETPVARRAELHRTAMDSRGIMTMQEVDKIVLEPKTFVELEPGDLHIMLMGMEQRLMEGMEFPLTLHFDHAPSRTIRVEVMPMTHKREDMMKG